MDFEALEPNYLYINRNGVETFRVRDAKWVVLPPSPGKRPPWWQVRARREWYKARSHRWAMEAFCINEREGRIRYGQSQR